MWVVSMQHGLTVMIESVILIFDEELKTFQLGVLTPNGKVHKFTLKKSNVSSLADNCVNALLDEVEHNKP